MCAVLLLFCTCSFLLFLILATSGFGVAYDRFGRAAVASAGDGSGEEFIVLVVCRAAVIVRFSWPYIEIERFAPSIINVRYGFSVSQEISNEQRLMATFIVRALRGQYVCATDKCSVNK